jgi:hypothetical protein
MHGAVGATLLKFRSGTLRMVTVRGVLGAGASLMVSVADEGALVAVAGPVDAVPPVLVLVPVPVPVPPPLMTPTAVV